MQRDRPQLVVLKAKNKINAERKGSIAAVLTNATATLAVRLLSTVTELDGLQLTGKQSRRIKGS